MGWNGEVNHVRTIGVTAGKEQRVSRLLPFPDGVSRVFSMDAYDWQLLDGVVGQCPRQYFRFACDLYSTAAVWAKEDSTTKDVAIRERLSGVIECLQELRVIKPRAANRK